MNGQPAEFLLRARKRGVKFDVGHGGGSFHFRLAAPLVKAGFYPDSISTDMHTQSMNAAMQDMPTTMSKFLAMGMPLVEVIRRQPLIRDPDKASRARPDCCGIRSRHLRIPSR